MKKRFLVLVLIMLYSILVCACSKEDEITSAFAHITDTKAISEEIKDEFDVNLITTDDKEISLVLKSDRADIIVMYLHGEVQAIFMQYGDDLVTLKREDIHELIKLDGQWYFKQIVDYEEALG